ncbi:MAG: thioredoxin domain-containing protein [bacterium]
MKIFIVIFISMFFIACTEDSEKKDLPENPYSKADRYNISLAGAPSKGPDNAALTIVNFSDLQCPFSKKTYRLIRSAQKKHPGDIRHVYRHFPLNFHDSALPAARAAAAAYLQGKFWEMHDRLIEEELLKPFEYYSGIAEKEGLNLKQFKSDYYSAEVTRIIDHDRAQGARFGVTGTPTLFFNGVRIVGISENRFRRLLSRELEKGREIKKNNRDVYAETAGQGAERYIIPKKPPPEISHDIFAVPIPKSAHMEGSENAEVTIIFFFDIQCPMSKMTYKIFRKLKERFSGKMRMVYVHNPRSFHIHAEKAARAVEAAEVQGKFMDMYEKFFEEQSLWKTLDENAFFDYLEKTVKSMDMSFSRFMKDFEGKQVENVLKTHKNTALNAGIRKTPVTFINGRMIPVPGPESVFSKVIKEEFLKAEQKLKDGVEPEELYRKIVFGGRGFVPSENPTKRYTDELSIRGDEVFVGDEDATGQIVVFFDFACASCGKVFDVTRSFAENHEVKFIFKHRVFSKHSNSREAAVFAAAVYLAHGREAFFNVAKDIFKNIEKWQPEKKPRSFFMKILENHELASAPVFDEIKSVRADTLISSDMLSAAQAGVEDVPAFAGGGRLVSGYTSVKDMKFKIKKLLDNMKKPEEKTENLSKKPKRSSQ